MTESTFKMEGHDTKSPRAGHVSLVLSIPPHGLQAVALRDGQSLVVGRSSPAEVVIDDRSLSRTHARFSLTNGQTQVEDLKSTNGTFVNEQRVSTAFVSEGDVIRLGVVEVRISGSPHQVVESRQVLSLSAFMKALDAELERARFFGRSMGLFAMRHAASIRGSDVAPKRPVDVVCAYAPGYSLLLAPEVDASSALTLAERMQQASDPRAFGIALYPAHAASSEELLSLALSAARSAGSKQMILAEPPKVLDRTPIIASASTKKLYELIDRVARTTLPVLVLGETGAGKELAARAVHDRSPRASAPYRALNCATIPANLIESVLFGHERGAFTGADKQSPGVFEQAHGGTVFLDEVAELAPQAQAALLRVLETKRLVRVGGAKEIEVDVRVIAATHRDLGALVRGGAFRQDLMFRLDALSLRVPPLRERREEIPLLAEAFLLRARTDWNISASAISPDALDALVAYSWPGNVRQLKNVIERAATICRATMIELEDLGEELCAEPSEASRAPVARAEAGSALPDRVRDFEVNIIREALEKAAGNVAEAARALGVPRRTLSNKVHQYGLV